MYFIFLSLNSYTHNRCFLMIDGSSVIGDDASEIYRLLEFLPSIKWIWFWTGLSNGVEGGFMFLHPQPKFPYQTLHVFSVVFDVTQYHHTLSQCRTFTDLKHCNVYYFQPNQRQLILIWIFEFWIFQYTIGRNYLKEICADMFHLISVIPLFSQVLSESGAKWTMFRWRLFLAGHSQMRIVSRYNR